MSATLFAKSAIAEPSSHATSQQRYLTLIITQSTFLCAVRANDDHVIHRCYLGLFLFQDLNTTEREALTGVKGVRHQQEANDSSAEPRYGSASQLLKTLNLRRDR